MQSEWATTALADCVDLLTGFPFKSASYVPNGEGIRLLRGDNVAQGTLRWEDARCWPTEELADLGDYFLQKDDVVLAMDRPWIAAGLKFAYIRESDMPSLLVQRVARLRARRHLDARYLRYVIGGAAFTDYVLGVQTGTAVPHISRQQILTFRFPLPPLSIQREVGALLGCLDDRIHILRQTNTTLESIAQALFKSWFIDFDPVRAKAEGREPEGMDSATAALFPAEFEESALGLIPKGWRATRLGSLIELAYGKALKATERRPGRVPVYGSGGITGYHDESLVKDASIVVGRKGTVGALYWEDKPFFPIDTTFYVRPKAVPLSFCFYAMQQLGLEHMNTDAAVPGLNRENAYRLDVVQPASSVVDAFDDVVTALRKAIRANSERAETIAEIRDSLLPRLISGKLGLPEAEEQLEDALA